MGAQAPTTSLLLPRNLSHLAGPVLAAPHFCFGSPDRRSSSPWLDARLGDKGAAVVGETDSTRASEPSGVAESVSAGRVLHKRPR